MLSLMTLLTRNRKRPFAMPGLARRARAGSTPIVDGDRGGAQVTECSLWFVEGLKK